MLPRPTPPLVALLVASSTVAFAASADEPKAKAKPPVVAASAKPTPPPSHPHKPKVHAQLKKKHLPPLPAKEPAKPEVKKAEPKAEAKAEPKKAEPKDPKAVDPKKDEPPPELTGALPQAKLAHKKPTDKKDAKVDGKPGAKVDAKVDAKKVDPKLDPKKDDKKHKPSKVGSLEDSFPQLHKKGEAKKKLKNCLAPAVHFARLGDADGQTVSLTTCAGGAAPGALDAISILARPYDVAAPGDKPESVLALPKKHHKASKALVSEKTEIAPGIRRLDPGMISRLQAIATHFPGKTITMVSGYRPQSKGSPHQAARALDIRIDGVTNEALVAFCKTLQDTGCGYYPNSYFVHVDVRKAGAGHVYWIDVSGPGEKPQYVKTWPLPLPPAKGPTSTTKDAPVLLDVPSDVPVTTEPGKIGPLEDDSEMH